MKTPWLSVICPVCNGEKFLPQALDSIFIQNDEDLECIIIDDNSTDSTMSILESYQEKFPLIIKQQKNRNWVTNTNYGISLATGKYVCFLHQDDIWFPKRLLKLKDIALRNPEIGLIIHSSIFISEAGKPLGVWNCPLPRYPKITTSKKLVEKLIIQNFISIPAPIFKRELFEGLEGLNSNLWYTADWDLWLHIASKTDAIYLPDLLAGFRIHPNSQTILGSANTANFQQQLEFVFNKHVDMLSSDKKEEISKTAKFSILLNVALAKSAHKEKIKHLNILAHFIKLGPIGWYRYVRDSRIFERVCARLIAKLQPLK